MTNILADSAFSSTFIRHNSKDDKLLDQNSGIFDLSSMQSIQSLEDILKEPDPEPIDESFLVDLPDDLSLNARFLEEIHAFDDNSDVTSIATTSSLSRDSTHASWQFSLTYCINIKNKLESFLRKRPVRRKPKSHMLRCIRLRGISSQLVSANEKIRCGAPTSITIGCTHIAVGTAHGLTLLFDSRQILKFCIGHSKDAYDFGPVTSLCFNGEDSRLLIGFAKGCLLLYDLLKSTTSGLKLLRRCDVLSQLGNGILSAKFVNYDTLADPAPPAIVNDAGGSVYILEWRGSPDKSCKCIFAGSKGDVCRAEPLTSTFFDSSLLALASLTKLIVVRLKPKIQVIFTMENKIDESSKLDIVQQAKSPPLVCWRPISTNGHLSEVHLAYGRSKTIHIIEISKRSKFDVVTPDAISAKNNNLHAVLLKKLILKVNVDTDVCASYDPMLINMAWISAKCLLTFDQNERARLYDVFGEKEHCVECSDVSHIQLVYSTATFKGLATGGNVSPAMAFMAENACFNSLGVYSYGPSTGQVVLLGHRAVFALSLSSWLDCVNALVYCNNENQTPDFIGAISLCLDYFTGRKQTGLSSASPSRDAKNGSNEKSLSNRKMMIIQEKAVALVLEYVDLSMVKFAPSCGKIEALQEYYKNIIPFCLETCFELQREDIIYTTLYERFGIDALAKGIFLECLDDYILDDRLVDPPPSLIQEFIGHMEREGLYSVIESCVVHLPVHCLDLHQVMTFCRDHNLYDAIIYIFNYGLMDYMTSMKEMLQILGEILQHKDFLSDEDVRLGNKLLLYVTCCLNGRSYFTYRVSDMKKDELICETYELLTDTSEKYSPSDEISKRNHAHLRTLLKFDCKEFLNGLGMVFENEFFRSRNGSVKVRFLVDLLLDIMLKSQEFTAFQTSALFTFITRNMIMRSGELLVGSDRFYQILEVVMCGDDEENSRVQHQQYSSVFEEKQQALLDLLHTRELAGVVDENILLSLAEKHLYYQVCEVIYRRRRVFDKILDCYSNDFYRRTEIFDYVRNILSNADILLSEKLSVKTKFLRLIKSIAKADIKRCVRLIDEHFANSLMNICAILGEEDRILYEILTELLDLRCSNSAPEVSNDSYLFSYDQAEDSELIKIFAGLICIYADDADGFGLLRFFSKSQSLLNQEVLTICQARRMNAAVIYLSFSLNCEEKAFDLLEKETAACSSDRNFVKFDKFVKSAFTSLNGNTYKDKSNVKALWLKLLDVILNSALLSAETYDLKFILYDAIREMMIHVDAFSLFSKVLNHQLFRSTPFCDLKPLIIIILKEYRYEEIFLEALINCIRSETRHSFKILENAISKRRFANIARFCRLCDQILTGIGDYIILPCSHAFHSSCFRGKNAGRRLKNIHSKCPICNGNIRFDETSRQQQASRNNQTLEDEVETPCRKQVSFLMRQRESNQLSWKMDTLEQLGKKNNVRYSYNDYIDHLAKERSKMLENLNLPCGPKRA